MKPSSIVHAGLAMAAVTFVGVDPASASSGTGLFPAGATPAWTCSFATSSNPDGGPTTVAPIPSSSSFALGGSAVIGGSGGNATTLTTYPVYIIFMGTDWTTDGTYNGPLTSAAQSIISGAQTITGSSYFSGLVQYGSSGSATYAGYYVDACTSRNFGSGSAYYETYRATTSHGDCPNANLTQFAGGLAPQGGDARQSAIYVVVHDTCIVGTTCFAANDFTGPNSTGVANCPKGSNYCTLGNNTIFTGTANMVDMALQSPISSPGEANLFSWFLSHEIAERLSTGIGAREEQCASPGAAPGALGQICDGEPEDEGDALSINGVAPVTGYWSIADQAFIAPGATIPNSDSAVEARVLLKNVYINNSSNTVSKLGTLSLRQGTLSALSLGAGSVPSGTAIDTNIASYTVDASGNVYDLTTSGQVKKLTGTLSSPAWTAVTGAPTVATQILAPTSGAACPRYGVVGGGLYMIASNGGAAKQIWQYQGSGTNWTALTGTNTTVNGFAATVATTACGTTSPPTPPTGSTSLYLWAGGSQAGMWHWSGSGQNWTQITASSTTVLEVATANGQLYMNARNGTANNQIWQYTGSGTNNNWTAITPSSAMTEDLLTDGTVLTTNLTTAPGSGQNTQLYQYIPGGSLTSSLFPNWTPITGSNTMLWQGVSSTLQDGIELYMMASVAGANAQAWEFEGIAAQSNSTWGFTPLTSTSSYQVDSLELVGNALQMYAVPSSGGTHEYQYTGTPLTGWTLLQ